MKRMKLLNFTELEPIDELDDEEIAIHKSLKNGEYESLNSSEKQKYSKIFKESNKRSKAISLRLQERDYIGIKAKAMELGMPYQSLINSIIHTFLTGNLHKI